MEDEIVGQVYFSEEDQRFHYHCANCSTSFSGSDGARIDQKADDHEDMCKFVE